MCCKYLDHNSARVIGEGNGRSERRLIFIYDGGYGIQSHVFTLASELKTRGFGVNVISLHRIKQDKISVVSLAEFAKRLIESAMIIFRTMALMKKERPLVIHVHSPRISLLIGYFLHFLGRVPLVVTIHERASYGLLTNRLYKRANKVIAISPEIEKELIRYGMPEGKLVVIPNMVNTTEFSPAHDCAKVSLKRNSFRLLSVGRLDFSKEELLRAAIDWMPIVMSFVPEAALLVIGDGPRLEAMRKLASDVNRVVGRNIVSVLGHVTDLVGLLRSADAVIGIGRSAIEAMSCCKPVIVGSSSGKGVLTGGLVTRGNIPELCKYNFSGRHFSEVLDSERFCKIIVELSENKDYREKVGAEGRQYVKQHLDVCVIAKKTASVYSEMYSE